MGAIGDIAGAGLSMAAAGMKARKPGLTDNNYGLDQSEAAPTGSGFDLSQAKVSGTGLDTNPLYQSSADGYYGTGAVSIGGVGQTRFKDLSNLKIR